MGTGKKLISILLILVMAVLLFSGCFSSNRPKNTTSTTLEGTWRMIKNEIYDVASDEIIEEIPYPNDETEWDVTVYTQPYIQFKNNMVLFYKYMKIEVL